MDNPLKIILVLLVVALIFGAKRLPELGKGLGKGIREFKDATSGLHDDVKQGLNGQAQPQAMPPAPQQQTQPAPPPPPPPPAE